MILEAVAATIVMMGAGLWLAGPLFSAGIELR